MQSTVETSETAADLQIEARDGYPLAVTVRRPSHSPSGAPVIIFGSATAVPRAYYAGFAQALVARGHVCVTFDYRGVAASAPKPPMTLRSFPYPNRTWGTIDIPSVIDWVRQTYPDRPIRWVGHSFGGFGFGLADNNHFIQRTLNVATPYSYWGLMDGAEKYRIAVLAYVAMPIVTRLTGKLPGWSLGGADLPGTVAREWARWLRSPSMFFDDATLPERQYFSAVTADMLFLRIADDPWATDRGALALAKHFAHARIRHQTVRPADVGVKGIGHIAYFKPRFQQTLWPRALDWISSERAAP